MPDVPAGERFTDPRSWEDTAGDGPHLWRTLGYRRTAWEPGSSTIEWDAGVDYTFPTKGGPIIQGGLVTALLDSAMGGACWTVLDFDQAFLTADLRVEFLRPTRPGLVHATGVVIRRTRRAVFCAADLYDESGQLLATSRCTQVVLPAEGGSGRYGPPDPSGAPPEDARG
ncbi:MAG: PaaI family thioesterase [Actinomycetota bacterium]|nr:PaaI family thioesterase [Actinomycetota bacterium]